MKSPEVRSGQAGLRPHMLTQHWADENRQNIIGKEDVAKMEMAGWVQVSRRHVNQGQQVSCECDRPMTKLLLIFGTSVWFENELHIVCF